MRRKVCRGLRGIGRVGPVWLVNGRIVTGLRFVDHSRDSMLQTSTNFLHKYKCVLHVTVNVVIVYIAIAVVFVGMLHVHLWSVCVGFMWAVFVSPVRLSVLFVCKCVSMCICVVQE